MDIFLLLFEEEDINCTSHGVCADADDIICHTMHMDALVRRGQD